MFKKIFSRVLIDLGELEGDYRAFHLRSDITQSVVTQVIVMISILGMLWVDAILLRDRQDLFILMVCYRGSFTLVTIAAVWAILKAKRVRDLDRLYMGWTFLAIVFLILLNLVRPPDYLTSAFDVIVPLAIYILSPLKIKQNSLLALGFSVSTLYVNHFYRTTPDPLTFNLSLATQIIVHVLGLGSALQIQTYRRRSFKAFIQERDAKEIAAYLSKIDPLTQSMTRSHFFNFAASEFLRYSRYRRPLSMIVMDADRFKNINDTHGHHAGDVVLRSLSLVVLEQKRTQDTFGRLGGEEFGLLLPETRLEQAKVVAERVQKAWEKTPSNMDGELIYSTVSIGVTEATPTDKSFDDVLRRADRMMYKAKERGRNQVVAE